jgi:LmbE family N-acetylglucosaminyl deacetylase
VCGLVRDVNPDIVLTHPPEDYMEDHTATCRVAVTAAFARGMPNYRSQPSRKPVSKECAVYHSMPHGLESPLRIPAIPHAVVNTSAVHAEKRAALACHKSQKEWLDRSQGTDSYLVALDRESRAIGELSGRFEHGEGWFRHLHLGFGPEDYDPLRDALEKNFHALKIGKHK